ncbi:STAS domain-containing protein [Actinocrinis sp.]|uniref:STAS domain-containing protein n=1 Tax=Actinocrinis sp. TaxID=1920516 RepID=UPI002D330BD0|nr:STAS domain-containing protein [Actinocrinis sp.]HZP49598.1 STAS domain-containing protein [Actinocrinis sp.]
MGGRLKPEVRWQETVWLRVSVRTQPDHTLVVLAGELDIADAEPLAFQLSALISAGHTRIVADLTELLFCDAPGLRTLEQAARRAALRGGWVRLAGTRTPIKRIIRIAKLTQPLPAYDTVENALADRDEPPRDGTRG